MGFGAPLGYSAAVAVDQVVGRQGEFPVFDSYYWAWAAAAAAAAAQLEEEEAGLFYLHSEHFLEAVLEQVAPAQGCHSLRNKDLCCKRGLYIQTLWVPITYFRSKGLINFLVRIIQEKEGGLLLEWGRKGRGDLPF